ncbi:MAG: hypothetical protein NVV63_02485 [Opitutus sp.]|nr:hypothetical protein [Opitutus sp.]
MTPLRKFITRSGHTLCKQVRQKNGKSYLSYDWYMRVQHRGCRKWVSLHENPKTAERMANELAAALRSKESNTRTLGEILAAMEQSGERFSPKPRAVQNVSTLGELRDAVDLGGANLGVNLVTAREYVRSTFTIVWCVLGKRKKQIQWKSQIPELPVSVLTASLLYDFKSERLPPGLQNHTEPARRAKATANRHLRNTQALFRDERMQFLRAAGLRLPAMEEYRAVSTFTSAVQRYELPEGETILRVAKKIVSELPQENRKLYVAAVLALHAGLRRQEIASARWSWVVQESDGLKLHVKAEEDFAPKFGTNRKVKITGWLAAQLGHRDSAKGVTILGGSLADNLATTERLVLWLKGAGVTAKKPIHELRKWFGSFFATEYGITVAQRQLGHSTPMITNSHYAGINFPPSLRMVWFDPELSAPLESLLARLHQPVEGQIRDAFGFPANRYHEAQ